MERCKEGKPELRFSHFSFSKTMGFSFPPFCNVMLSYRLTIYHAGRIDEKGFPLLQPTLSVALEQGSVWQHGCRKRKFVFEIDEHLCCAVPGCWLCFISGCLSVLHVGFALLWSLLATILKIVWRELDVRKWWLNIYQPRYKHRDLKWIQFKVKYSSVQAVNSSPYCSLSKQPVSVWYLSQVLLKFGIFVPVLVTEFPYYWS